MRGTQKYKCCKCETEFEYFHMGSDDQAAECSECQTKTEEHEKVFTLGQGHILKGKGWYRDGY